MDYESKTDQGATGTWFAFPRKANDPTLDTMLLFNKYRHIIGKKNADLLEGRLWVRIDGSKEKDGSMKVTRQWRGKEWISGVPKHVATWLGLQEAGKYTGHTFRWACAQWAADGGMTETQMQHHFGWKSISMIQCYSRSSKKLKLSAAIRLNVEEVGGQEESGSKGNNGKMQEVEELGHEKNKQESEAKIGDKTHQTICDQQRPTRANSNAAGVTVCELPFSEAERQIFFWNLLLRIRGLHLGLTTEGRPLHSISMVQM